MSFQLRLHVNLTAGLVAACDFCGAVIKDASNANLCWDGPEVKTKTGDCFRYRIACKGKCTFAFDRKYGHQWTQQLDVGIGYLINNTHINMKSTKRKMALLHSLGF